MKGAFAGCIISQGPIAKSGGDDAILYKRVRGKTRTRLYDQRMMTARSCGRRAPPITHRQSSDVGLSRNV